jgi:signal transduction histidine kinase
MIKTLDAMVASALLDGFTGLRCSGEMPQEQTGTLFDERDVVDYELRLGEFCPSHKIVGICRYDLKRSPPRLVREALRLHPLAVIGPLVCPNVYYEPPAMALGRCSERERVRWMVEQLTHVRREKIALEKAVAARDEFLSAASHELRTPLASAQLQVQGVLRQAQSAGHDLPASWVVPRLQRAHEQFEKLVQLIQRLLDASQMSAGRLQFHLEELDLNTVVRDALARLEGTLERAGCPARFTAAPEPVVGPWDRLRLEQVVTNLLANAAKYGAGSEIEVVVERQPRAARLVVRDHGIGIPAEDLPRIFGRFEQAAPGAHYGGFGLGLWIVKKIVEAFGGTVWASSAGPGTGATFTVELPIEGTATT